MSRVATQTAASIPIAKQIPCADAIVAVLIPTTRPSPETSGPPELPGLRGASVWITLSINAPDRVRNVRPSALTMPAVTVQVNPRGLPIAITICPTRRVDDEPNVACGNPPAARRKTAMSVIPSPPTRVAAISLPSVSVAPVRAARATTWWLVST